MFCLFSRKELKKTGQLHWNTILKLLELWYGKLPYAFHRLILSVVLMKVVLTFWLIQVMLYVDMEVNGHPLKVGILI